MSDDGKKHLSNAASYRDGYGGEENANPDCDEELCMRAAHCFSPRFIFVPVLIKPFKD